VPAIRDALVAVNSKILATLPWRPKRNDLDTIVADALGMGSESWRSGAPG
jgi:UDP-glucose 4-epimerase